MNIAAVVPWVFLGGGVIQAVAAIRGRRAGGPGVHAAASVMSIALGISLLTSGWVRDLAWAVSAAYGVWMTVHVCGERSLPLLVFSIPLYALMLVITGSELLFDDLSTGQRALFGTMAAFIASALVAMTVHLVQRLRYATGVAPLPEVGSGRGASEPTSEVMSLS